MCDTDAKALGSHYGYIVWRAIYGDQDPELVDIVERFLCFIMDAVRDLEEPDTRMAWRSVVWLIEI